MEKESRPFMMSEYFFVRLIQREWNRRYKVIKLPVEMIYEAFLDGNNPCRFKFPAKLGSIAPVFIGVLLVKKKGTNDDDPFGGQDGDVELWCLLYHEKFPSIPEGGMISELEIEYAQQ